jgi:hypothetical protein
LGGRERFEKSLLPNGICPEQYAQRLNPAARGWGRGKWGRRIWGRRSLFGRKLDQPGADFDWRAELDRVSSHHRFLDCRGCMKFTTAWQHHRQR